MAVVPTRWLQSAPNYLSRRLDDWGPAYTEVGETGACDLLGRSLVYFEMANVGQVDGFHTRRTE